MKMTPRAIAKTGISAAFLAGQFLAIPYSNAQSNIPYEVRAYFRLVDSNGLETRRMEGTNVYILEAIAEHPMPSKNPVVKLNFDIEFGKRTKIVKSIQPEPLYGYEDYFFKQEMSPNFNYVGEDSSVRQTKRSSPWIGVHEGKGIFARYLVQSNSTNSIFSEFSFKNFFAFEEGGITKPTRVRTHKIQVAPEGYDGLDLIADTQDGEGNDGRKTPEIITIGNSKPSVLWKSTGDANGPYSQVWTNSPSLSNPSASGCYIDRNVNLTQGGAKAFYKVTPVQEVVGASKPAAR